ncbi:MAG: hypothetical protein ACTHK1_06385 [Actinomycetales bacterium]
MLASGVGEEVAAASAESSEEVTAPVPLPASGVALPDGLAAELPGAAELDGPPDPGDVLAAVPDVPDAARGFDGEDVDAAAFDDGRLAEGCGTGDCCTEDCLRGAADEVRGTEDARVVTTSPHPAEG